MIDADFAKIERTLGVSMPRAYRRVMSAYPFGDDRPSDAYIPDSADYVCNLNQQIVADSVYARWHYRLFAVGTTWDGDAHVLDTSLDDSPVYRFHQDSDATTTLAPTLDDWIDRLMRWYVNFDCDAASSDYRSVTKAIQDAGFYITSPEPMDGWHRITVSSKRGGGNSFWIAVIKRMWFVGAWGGNIYRIGDNADQFCVAWLSAATNGTSADFSDAITEEYNLNAVSDTKFDSIVAAS